MIKWLKNKGPGTLIVAAFIGPGTVTVCVTAGVQYGFALLWAVLLSIIATIVLQEMSARAGIITQKELTASIRDQFDAPILKWTSVLLIFGAIVIGNTAYEAGNISGASLGMTALFPEDLSPYFPMIIGSIAFIILLIGNYKVLERILVTLVILMSLSFIITAIITQPDLGSVFKGMFVPSVPEKAGLLVIGIIGTTVVPYNIFLHSSLVKEKWNKAEDLKEARSDLFVSIILGGLVSMAIVISAASMMGGEVNGVMDLAKGLKPLYGSSAKYFIGIGLFAAGITSAITAPLAAAYVAKGCFNWEVDLKSWKFRTVWMSILVFGVVVSSLEFKPVVLITFAQVANGLLLPIIALFLIWIVNRSKLLGEHTNTIFQNIMGGLIILITLVLGIKGIITAFG